MDMFKNKKKQKKTNGYVIYSKKDGEVNGGQ